MQISKNFHLREFTRSMTAIRHGIDNTPSDEIKENIIILTNNILQPLRDKYRKPIHVASGYRCDSVNQRVGGSRNSQHKYGYAADIDTSVDNFLLFSKILDMEFDQLIWEFGTDMPEWVHVSYVLGNNRNEILRASRENNITVYKHFIPGDVGL